MGLKPFVIKPADRKPALDVLGTQVTVLASRDGSSDHRVTFQSGAEGSGPPPHSHDWDESFFVSAGQIQFTCGGETTMCTTGTFVHVPAGTVHAFNYGPGGGAMIEMTSGNSQAIEMFSALAREIPPGPPDVAKAIQVLEDHNAKVHL
jgi:quercetin dioxygenase-like cupin family protein